MSGAAGGNNRGAWSWTSWTAQDSWENNATDTFLDLIDSNWTGVDYSNMDTEWEMSFPHNRSYALNGTFDEHADSRTLRDVMITCVAVLIMAVTIFGNTLVIIAVCTERRLRKVGNSFIVSLALSDLLVGLIVTPLSLSYELLQEWRLGESLCDFWVSMDVICCTASIMNLCAISYDRHNAITRPLVYAMKRTPKRASIMIAIVWFYAIVIALPPLFGWREKKIVPSTQCHVSEDYGYTIYSTFGAFYLPAIVMATLYLRVYKAAKKRQQQWIPGPGTYSNCVVKKPENDRNSNHKTKSLTLSTPFRSTANLLDNTDVEARKGGRELIDFSKISLRFNKKQKVESVNPHIGFRLMLSGKDESGGECSPKRKRSNHSMLSEEEGVVLNPSNGAKIGDYRHGVVYFDTDSPSGPKRLIPSVYSVISEEGSDSPSMSETPPEWSPVPRRTALVNETASLGRWKRSMRFSERLNNKTTNGSCNNNIGVAPSSSPTLNSIPNMNRRTTMDRRGSALDRIKNVLQRQGNVDQKFLGKLNQGLKNVKKERQKNRIYIQQERRAAKTLGIIMSAFVCCWLPFFINALAQPFCKCVPEILYPIVLWLGYFNSALNPIIYTFFNRDFRKAFSNILHVICCCERQADSRQNSSKHLINLSTPTCR